MGEVRYFTLVCDDVPYSVVLTDPGPRTMDVLKEISRLTGLSLWHGKLLIGQLPATVLGDQPEAWARAAVSALRAAGAVAQAVEQDAWGVV
ncbi:ribosomal protein L7/L12 [Kitasatospora viridis]|uniref:Large subunit ribosomal protein L7/L12 n=1 Tax=Kitasatospora viridis TaxID=281105 RepID=A0A561T6Z5_9ACTN|nr:ribosomal protein L7/L12 [Kitasatospora viridis]TWF82877.1 large subunit ribosomal protein L7/L12 [Kitasatospora viridis]